MSAPWDPRFFERSPAFASVERFAAMFASSTSFPSPEAIDEALSPCAGIRFRRQPPKPRRQRSADVPKLYDTCIVEDGLVPTRPGSWHDLLNALVWAAFPRAKRALHHRQHRIVVRGAPRRTREGDALALLDEGGVLTGLPGEAPHTSTSAAGSVFGHALFESIVEGRLPVWGSTLGLASEPSIDERDQALAAVLDDPRRLVDPDELGRTVLSEIPSP